MLCHLVFQVPQEEQVQVLMQLYESAPDDALKVKCIGTLECLAQCPEAIDANRVSQNLALLASCSSL